MIESIINEFIKLEKEATAKGNKQKSNAYKNCISILERRVSSEKMEYASFLQWYKLLTPMQKVDVNLNEHDDSMCVSNSSNIKLVERYLSRDNN